MKERVISEGPPRLTRIPGVFPFLEIERDEDGFATKIVVTGVSDKLVITAAGLDPTPYLDINFNGEDFTVDS